MPRHSWLGSAVVRWWLVPCHSWLRGLVAGPRLSWLGFAAGCGGWSLATPGQGPRAWFPATPRWGPPVVVVEARSPLLAVGPGVPFSLALVCVCVCCVAPTVGVGVVRWACAVWWPCVCLCVRAVCGLWDVSYLGWFASSVDMDEAKKQKKRSCRCVAEMRNMRNAIHIPLYLSHRAFVCLWRVSVRRPLGGWLGVRWVRSYLSSCGSCFFFRVVLLSFTHLVSLRVVPCISVFFRSVLHNIPLCRTLRVFPIERACKVWGCADVAGGGFSYLSFLLGSASFFFGW